MRTQTTPRVPYSITYNSGGKVRETSVYAESYYHAHAIAVGLLGLSMNQILTIKPR
jgi:hypothetical protein